MMSLAPVIYIVDDDPSFRTATARLLRASGYRTVEYGSGALLLERLPSARTGCILLDVKMPDLSGPQVQDRLVALGYPLPIVFLTGHGDIPMSVQAIKTGAEDFLTKPVTKERLLQAVRSALMRNEKARSGHGQAGGLRALAATLTPREAEVLALVVHGKLNKQIAHELGTSERTIKAHRSSVMTKLQARSLIDLVLIAERLGILDKPPATELKGTVHYRPEPAA
jgi:FixJ family two-component response regulator